MKLPKSGALSARRALEQKDGMGGTPVLGAPSERPGPGHAARRCCCRGAWVRVYRNSPSYCATLL